MKRTSFRVAVAGCITLSLLASADAIDRTKVAVVTPTTPAINTPQLQFNPSTLPGQTGFGSQGGFVDPFLPNNIYNPFPTLPGVTTPTTPSTLPGGGSTLPNTFPTTTPSGLQTDRNRIQQPVPSYLNPSQPQTTENRWRLGVMSRDTEVGVQIHEVVRNSAAARAGLEPQDIIVAVHGYQVGIVNGNLFEMSREFERHADRSGMVTMLVQDHRTRNLMNLPIQLDSRFSRIQGSVALPSGRQFPTDATIVVELQEIIRQGMDPMTITRREFRNTNLNQFQVPFELDYDPAQLAHRGEFVLTGSVFSQGQVVFRASQQFLVNSQGMNDGRQIALRLEAVRPTYGSPVHIDQESQVATIVRWFNDYLGRAPSDRELSAWLDALRRGYALRDVQLELLANNQFFNSVGRNRESYITRIHQLLVNKNPSQQEMDYWVTRYEFHRGDRREMAREFQDAVGIR